MAYRKNNWGVYDKIYHLLWLKSELFKQSDLQLNLPETVLFDRDHPIFWYYSTSSGDIRKKKQDNISLESIIEKFSSFKNESGINAYYIKENANQLLNIFCLKFFLKDQ